MRSSRNKQRTGKKIYPLLFRYTEIVLLYSASSTSFDTFIPFSLFWMNALTIRSTEKMKIECGKAILNRQIYTFSYTYSWFMLTARSRRDKNLLSITYKMMYSSVYCIHAQSQTWPPRFFEISHYVMIYSFSLHYFYSSLFLYFYLIFIYVILFIFYRLVHLSQHYNTPAAPDTARVEMSSLLQLASTTL